MNKNCDKTIFIIIIEKGVNINERSCRRTLKYKDSVNIMKLKYNVAYSIKKAAHGVNEYIREHRANRNELFNLLLVVLNIVLILFNCFPQINPFLSDLETRANNSETYAQVTLANMYYNLGNYESAYQMYAMLAQNRDKKVAGIAFNNMAVICNNCYLNYDITMKDNENLIYSIFVNLHSADDYGNEVATKNLELFSNLYDDPTSNENYKYNYNTAWKYDRQVISDVALISTEETKCVIKEVKTVSNIDNTNSYMYIYDIYVKSNEFDKLNYSVNLKYDTNINTVK